MDIIITGEQSAGKSHAAEQFIKNYRKPYCKPIDGSDVLLITKVHPAYAEMMRTARCRVVVFDGPIVDPESMLVAVAAVKEYRKQINTDILAVYVAPGEAVMLTDGVQRAENKFRTPEECARDHKPSAARREWLKAQDSFLPHTIAAKVGHCVCPAGHPCENGPICEAKAVQRATNDSKVRDYMHMPIQNRTDRILAELWELVVDKADEAGHDQMEAYLTQLVILRLPTGFAAPAIPALHHLDNEGKILLHEFLLTLLRKYE